MIKQPCAQAAARDAQPSNTTPSTPSGTRHRERGKKSWTERHRASTESYGVALSARADTWKDLSGCPLQTLVCLQARRGQRDHAKYAEKKQRHAGHNTYMQSTEEPCSYQEHRGYSFSRTASKPQQVGS